MCKLIYHLFVLELLSLFSFIVIVTFWLFLMSSKSYGNTDNIRQKLTRDYNVNEVLTFYRKK